MHQKRHNVSYFCLSTDASLLASAFAGVLYSTFMCENTDLRNHIRRAHRSGPTGSSTLHIEKQKRTRWPMQSNKRISTKFRRTDIRPRVVSQKHPAEIRARIKTKIKIKEARAYHTPTLGEGREKQKGRGRRCICVCKRPLRLAV